MKYSKGVFEGDGCISQNHASKKIDIISGSILFIKDIEKLLNENNIFGRVYTERNNDKLLYIFNFGKRKYINKFKELIYKDS